MANLNSTLVKQHLVCSYSNKPLENPVIVIRCGDRLEQVVAEQFLGLPIKDGWKVNKGLNCPVCLLPAKGYIADPTMKNIIAVVSNAKTFPEQKANAYPGKSATFNLSYDAWQSSQDNKRIEFTSETEDSLIKEFSILDFKDSTRIQIKFNSSDSKSIDKYLRGLNVGMSLMHFERRFGVYRTTNSKELQCLFRAIKENNTFPVEYLSRLEVIVKKGCKAFENDSKVCNTPSINDSFLRHMFVESILRGNVEKKAPVKTNAYPGKSATFIHVQGNWEPFGPEMDLCRCMVFKSETEDSLIEKFKVLGYTSGRIRISISFKSEDSKDVDKYLRTLDVGICLSDFEHNLGFFITKNNKELQGLFTAIKDNNTIHADYLTKIEDVIKAGSMAPHPDYRPSTTEYLESTSFYVHSDRSHLSSQLLHERFFGCDVEKKVAVEPIAYPGKSATFCHKRGNWESIESDSDLCREMEFKSETEGALITKFGIYGYASGHVQIQIGFDPKDFVNINKYFASRGKSIHFQNHEQILGMFQTKDVDELQTVFKAIKDNNTIPAKYLSKIEDIVKAGGIAPDPDYRPSVKECPIQ